MALTRLRHPRLQATRLLPLAASGLLPAVFASCGIIPGLRCGGDLPAPPLSACIIPDDGDPLELVEGQEVVISLSGPVIDAAEGVPATGCYGGMSINANAETSSDAFWLRAADATGATWTLAVSVDGLRRPVGNGDMIDATFRYTPYAFIQSIGSLELRDDAGALELWIGEAGSISDLEPPGGLSIAEGDRYCKEFTTCGTWSAYDLDVSRGAASASVEYGETAELDGYRFIHGGYEHADEEGSSCPDWGVAHVLVSLAPAG